MILFATLSGECVITVGPLLLRVVQAIEDAIVKLSKKHLEHIAEYGTGNEKRLTGKHETASIDTFK